MKNIGLLLLLVTLCGYAVGCGEKASEPAPPADPAPPAAETDTPPADPAPTGDTE